MRTSIGLAMALLVASLAGCGHSNTQAPADGPACTTDCTTGSACSDPATDCPAAPACEIAMCGADQACTTAPDGSQDGMACGSSGICNGGACVPSSCGDGVVEPPEQCDFGSANGPGAGCEVTCMFSCALSSGACDDGDPCNGTETCAAVTVAGETGQKCSAGSAESNGTACGSASICLNAACTTGVCGDGFVTPPEECDDANATSGDGCEDNCTFSCVSTDPTRDCTPADACAGQGTCNDGTHVCAAGSALADNSPCGSGSDYCKTGTCTAPVCGNSVVERGETCDDGALNGTANDGCKSDCTFACVNPATDCGATPACEQWTCTGSHTCLATPDVADNGQLCGSGGLVCTNGSCASPTAVCGNGVVETGEQCDFGSGNGPGTGCETDCKFSCTIAPNSCSDGNACNGTETCGAVTVGGKAGQKCAAGTPEANGVACGSGDICLSQQCELSTCGDGFVDPTRGETCEPPSSGDCDANCHIIKCGDGVRAGSEQCDDGNLVNLDGCDQNCNFEQAQRVNTLAMPFTTPTDTFCTVDALAAAVTGSVARNELTTAINSGVADGSITIDFSAYGLTDLTGTNQPSFSIGVLTGTPQAGSGYTGSADEDWWYTTAANTINASRIATSQMPASIAAKVVTAGPSEISVTVSFDGVAVTMDIFGARVRANIGATSKPLEAAGTTPPGHLAAEHLDPALVSFQTMTAGDLCGNTTALSLASVQVPSALVGCGLTSCSQCYTTANTLLDVYINGCGTIVGTQVKATQPDTARTAGDVYKFTANASHQVTSCTKNGVADTLADCEANAGYTSLFKLTTDRVIAK